jgi:phytoene dehydrogenase-like protein
MTDLNSTSPSDAATEASRGTLPQSTDVVVIGAGHNGLVAAGYLARDGAQVTVIEAGPRPGGMTTSGPFIPEAPEHIVNPCAVDIISMLHSHIFRELELKRYGLEIIRPDPAYLALHPDGTSLALWKDPRRTAQEIEKFSKNDAKAFLEFVELLDALVATVMPILGLDFGRVEMKSIFASLRGAARNRKHLPDLIALLTGSATDALEERFEHPVVRGALLNLAAGAGNVDRPASGLGYILLILLSRVGVGRPVGGMQSLTHALVEGLRAHGGNVVTGAPVAEILHGNGKVRGVRLEDGREVEAKAVVSTCDVSTTFLKMLGEDVVDRKLAARIKASPANGTGSGPFKIDMALSSEIAPIQHFREDVDVRVPTLLLGTYESVRESFAAASRGEIPNDPALWIVAPSGVDSTQAPAGQETLYLYDVAEPVDPIGGWDANRDLAAERIIGKTAQYIKPLEDAEIGRMVETPQDLGDRLRVRGGCVTHIDMGLLRAGPLRPVMGLGTGKTPLEGLVLGGSSIHPGGGVTGLPGRTAANRTKLFLKRRR